MTTTVCVAPTKVVKASTVKRRHLSLLPAVLLTNATNVNDPYLSMLWINSKIYHWQGVLIEAFMCCILNGYLGESMLYFKVTMKTQILSLQVLLNAHNKMTV